MKRSPFAVLMDTTRTIKREKEKKSLLLFWFNDPKETYFVAKTHWNWLFRTVFFPSPVRPFCARDNFHLCVLAWNVFNAYKRLLALCTIVSFQLLLAFHDFYRLSLHLRFRFGCCLQTWLELVRNVYFSRTLVFFSFFYAKRNETKKQEPIHWSSTDMCSLFTSFCCECNVHINKGNSQ